MIFFSTITRLEFSVVYHIYVAFVLYHSRCRLPYHFFPRCLITRRGVYFPTPAVQCRAISDTGTGSLWTAVKAKSTENHGSFLPVLTLRRRGLFPGAPPSLPRRRPHRRRRHHPPHLHIKLPHPAHQRHDGSFHRSRLFYTKKSYCFFVLFQHTEAQQALSGSTLRSVAKV